MLSSFDKLFLDGVNMKYLLRSVFVMVSMFSLCSNAMTNLEKCTTTAEILKQAVVDLMVLSTDASLAKYTHTSAGKMVKKNFSGVEQENMMASTYKVAHALNNESMDKVQLAKKILDKQKIKYNTPQLVERAYDNMVKQIDNDTADCVLQMNALVAEKTKLEI